MGILLPTCGGVSQGGPNFVKKAFSILELLVSVTIVAVLVSLLLPALSRARDAGYQTVCAQNLRQLSTAWESYLSENKETFPQFGAQPDWFYGGAEFADAAAVPTLAADRPINKYIQQDSVAQASEAAEVFHCPADHGVSRRGIQARAGNAPSILVNGSCFREFGNSYRANGLLLNSRLAGIDRQDRPLFRHEIQVDPSRLILTGDTAWFYATRATGDDQGLLEASWHRRQDAGNMLAADGSVRFVQFATTGPGGVVSINSTVVLSPRP